MPTQMSRIYLLIAWLVASGISNSQANSGNFRGCTSEFLFPQQPFLVIWNEPSGGCDAHGINLNLSSWGIVENQNDTFAGDNMIIYYQLGHWPTYSQKTKAVFSGGVPQRGNLYFHLKEVYSQVRALKQNFSGVAVIDMESWRPLLVHNFDSLAGYHELSVDIVKARYPYFNNTETELEARREFDIGARIFFESTLNLTHQLRPDAHWGFYGFPRDWGGTEGQSQNDRLDYIWRASSGLFPEIYMNNQAPYKIIQENIVNTVNETFRVWAKFSDPTTLILPYTLCQDNGTNFFSKENLSLAIGLPGIMGAAGVVIWGSSGFFHTKEECHLLQNYVNTILGPYVKNMTDFLTLCSQKVCSSHGRCVRKDFERVYQFYQQESGHHRCQLNEEELQTNDISIDDVNSFDNYVCRCLKGWSGNHCEHYMTQKADW